MRLQNRHPIERRFQHHALMRIARRRLKQIAAREHATKAHNHLHYFHPRTRTTNV